MFSSAGTDPPQRKEQVCDSYAAYRWRSVHSGNCGSGSFHTWEQAWDCWGMCWLLLCRHGYSKISYVTQQNLRQKITLMVGLYRHKTDALPCHIHLPACLWIMDPHSRAAKKNMSLGNDVLPQDTMHLIQIPRYQQGSLFQDPAGSQSTWRHPDHHKESQTEVVWTYLPFIKSSQNCLGRHSQRGKKTRQTGKEVGSQHQGMDRLEFFKSQRAVGNREK